jgi:hypothetical protein
MDARIQAAELVSRAGAKSKPDFSAPRRKLQNALATAHRLGYYQIECDAHRLVESQSGFGAVPRDEIVDCEPVGPLKIGRAQRIEDGYLGAVQIRKAKNSLWAAKLLLGIISLYG